MKNLLIIIPHLTNGGAERAASELSIALADYYNVFVLLYEDRVTYPFSGKKIVINLQDKTRSILEKNIDSIIKLRNVKEKYHINYTISFLVHPNLVNIFSRNNDKVILSVHTHLSEYNRRKGLVTRLINFLSISLYNLADFVVCVSNGVEKDLASKFGVKKEKIRTIHNFYDFDKIRKLASQPLEPNHTTIFEKPVIINVGRLTYSKGQWNLIKAFKKVRESLDVNLIIIGDGKYREEYGKIIDELELNNSVFLLGFQSNPFMLIKRSELLVSASKFEGLSNVILEAIALGTPVISTDCKSGPREILAPDTEHIKQCHQISFEQFGVLVPVKHPEKIDARTVSFEEDEMAKAIIRMMTDKELRYQYSQLGLQRARSFSFDQQIGKWISILS